MITKSCETCAHGPERSGRKAACMYCEDDLEQYVMADSIHNPRHYQLLPGVEVIHVRRALLDKMPADWTPFQIDCWSRAWEYITRAPAKNGLEDLKKGLTYLDWLIEDKER